LKKIIHLDSHFSTGEATVQPVILWSGNKSYIEPITKHASVGNEYFQTIQPIPGHSIVYVLAVSGWETYGENKNGDGFPEFPVKEFEKPPWIGPEETLSQHYKTFEQFGHNYRHHNNKDPKKAVGKVMKAFWNPAMHRIELLIDLDDAKAPDLAERIQAGEYPPVSMGVRVKWDVCNICGNRAPTRKQYCDHLKFQMRAILPDGRRVCALNPNPKFFDISWVFKPADVIAYMMKKVAEPRPYEITGAAAGEYLDSMDERKYASRKLAVLDKVVQGIPVDAKTTNIPPSELNNMVNMRSSVLTAGQNTVDFPDNLLQSLSSFPLSKVFSTMFSGGMMMNTPEFTKIVIYKSRPGAQVDDDVLDKSVILQRNILEFLEEHPQIFDQLKCNEIFDLKPENIDPKIVELLEPYMEKRSGIGDYLSRRFVPEEYQQTRGPYTQMLSIQDPVSGSRYRTTRGAAIRAHDEIAKRNLYKILGGTALLGGAYKVIGGGLARHGLGKAKPLAGLALGALGLSQWPGMGKHYMTEQGIPIPTLTELAPQKYASVAMPLLGTLATMAVLGHDYTSRLRRGEPVGHPALPLSRQLLDRLGKFTHEHPLVSAGAGTLLLRGARGTRPARFVTEKLWPRAKDVGASAYTGAKRSLKDFAEGMKISSCLEKELPQSTDTVMLPEMNLDAIVEKIGKVIAEG
jgi:hypothetical protein